MPERLDALHEAARATAARLLDGEVVRATINEADPHVRTRWRADSLDALGRLAVIDLAGAVTETDSKAWVTDIVKAENRCLRAAMRRRDIDANAELAVNTAGGSRRAVRPPGGRGGGAGREQ
jgi:hypothetical protein